MTINIPFLKFCIGLSSVCNYLIFSCWKPKFEPHIHACKYLALFFKMPIMSFRSIWGFQRQKKNAYPKNDIVNIVDPRLLSRIWCNTQTSNFKSLYNEKRFRTIQNTYYLHSNFKTPCSIFAGLSLYFSLKTNGIVRTNYFCDSICRSAFLPSGICGCWQDNYVPEFRHW